MLRGFRHRLFLLLQAGIVLSGALAILLYREAWAAILIVVIGSVAASVVCERIASVYLRNTLGRLRRVADDIGHGRDGVQLTTQPGDDFHKLVKAINAVASRLADATREESRLQDELRRRERLAFLGELAATVAHEVNNPLDGLQNCTRILRRSLSDSARTEQMLGLIEDGLERIELIVRRLLTLARHNVIRPIDVSMRSVLESATAAVQSRLDTNGVTVSWGPLTSQDRVAADAALLEQVFVNLMINAVDSMPGGGRITLEIESSQAAQPGGEACVAVRVTDTGGGIPADVLPHIFEPFFTTKQGGRGTGLGLPIAARIVDAHRGRIEVEPRPDGGTIFTVTLPQCGPRPAIESAPAAPAPAVAASSIA